MKISLDSFREVLVRSGLLTAGEVEREAAELKARVIAERKAAEAVDEGGTATAAKTKLAYDARNLAQHLIAKDRLSVWQAEKLLAGKYKGFRLGKYKLIRLLGKGGMSSVYLAEHAVMKRRVAIKVLPHKRVDDASYLGRFHREAQAVASLDHPNIVRAFDVDHETDGSMEIHFLVMEYVDGLSLQEVVAKRGPLPPQEAADMVRQAALGLQHAHENGLVHRDIKPGNLLVDKNGTVRLLDLGLARFFDDSDENSLTVEHDEKVLGTADYLAPEQAVDSHSVDSRADLYSLGCTLYFLLTGEPPFTQGTLAQRLIAHQTKEPPRLSEKRDDVPAELDAILLKLMAKKPEDRPQTAADAAKLLDDWLRGTAGESDSVSPLMHSDSFGAFLEHLDSGADLSPSAPDLDPAAGSGVGPLSGQSEAMSDTTPAAGDPTPFPRKRGGRSSSNIHARGSSSIVARRKSSPPWGLIGALAAAAAVVGIGTFVLLRGDDAAPDPAPTKVAGSEPAVSRPAPSGSTITVGSAGNFGTLQEAVDYAAKNFGKLSAGGGVIELAAGETIPASIVLDSSQILDALPRGVTIRSAPGGGRAVLRGNGSDPVLTLRGVEELTISGVAFDAAGASTAVEVGGFVNRPVIEDFEARGFLSQAFSLRDVTSISGSFLTLRGGTVESRDASGVGVRVGGPGESAERIEVEGVRFLGPMATGLLAAGEFSELKCVRCVFDGCETGIKVDAGDAAVRNLRVIGNTFRDCPSPIAFAGTPAAGSKGFAFAQNVFAGGGPELTVRNLRRDAFERMRKDGGWTGENFSTRPKPTPAGDSEVLIVAEDGWSADPDFVSTDRDSADYLRPRLERFRTAGGGPEPRYIGAVNPAGE